MISAIYQDQQFRFGYSLSLSWDSQLSDLLYQPLSEDFEGFECETDEVYLPVLGPAADTSYFLSF
jgi:hypothetical protein